MPQHSRRVGAPISLGDALVAASQLHPKDATTREAIIAALGLTPRMMPAPVLPIGPWIDHDRRVDLPTDAKPDQPPSPKTSQPSQTTSQPPSITSRTQPHDPRISGGTAEIWDEGTSSFAVPDWAVAPADPFLAAEGKRDSLPPPPLFPPSRSRAILSAALATWSAGHELDLDRAMTSVANRRPLRELPLRRAPTLRRGVQMLIDQADAMAPFRLDIDALVPKLEQLFGSGHIQLLQFKHCPTRGVRQKASRRRGYLPPGRGAPALVVSDFGIGTPIEEDGFADAAEWLSFVRGVDRAGCRVVALTPFAPRRWPAALARAVTFVHWSEQTTARQVARAVREASQGDTV